MFGNPEKSTFGLVLTLADKKKCLRPGFDVWKSKKKRLRPGSTLRYQRRLTNCLSGWTTFVPAGIGYGFREPWETVKQ